MSKIDKTKKLREEKYLWEVLEKMCEFVEQSIETIDFNKNDWYTTYEWSEKTEKEFKDWLVDYLYNNDKARHSIMQNSIKYKANIKKFANYFVFQYGWKYEENTSI